MFKIFATLQREHDKVERGLLVQSALKTKKPALRQRLQKKTAVVAASEKEAREKA